MADEEWLSFMQAADKVSRARNVTFSDAEALLRAAIERDGLRTEIDHQFAAAIKSSGSLRNKRPTVEPGSWQDILGESARQGHLSLVLSQNPRVNKADLENWLREPVPEKLLKLAPKETIEATITAVYDEADKAEDKPPNINQLVKPVQLRLKTQGFRATSRQIKSIGGADQFAKRRGESGKRVT
jgi:hypothetical protein